MSLRPDELSALRDYLARQRGRVEEEERPPLPPPVLRLRREEDGGGPGGLLGIVQRVAEAVDPRRLAGAVADVTGWWPRLGVEPAAGLAWASLKNISDYFTQPPWQAWQLTERGPSEEERQRAGNPWQAWGEYWRREREDLPRAVSFLVETVADPLNWLLPGAGAAGKAVGLTGKALAAAEGAGLATRVAGRSLQATGLALRAPELAAEGIFRGVGTAARLFPEPVALQARKQANEVLQQLAFRAPEVAAGDRHALRRLLVRAMLTRPERVADDGWRQAVEAVQAWALDTVGRTGKEGARALMVLTSTRQPQQVLFSIAEHAQRRWEGLYRAGLAVPKRGIIDVHTLSTLAERVPFTRDVAEALGERLSFLGPYWEALQRHAADLYATAPVQAVRDLLTGVGKGALAAQRAYARLVLGFALYPVGNAAEDMFKLATHGYAPSLRRMDEFRQWMALANWDREAARYAADLAREGEVVMGFPTRGGRRAARGRVLAQALSGALPVDKANEVALSLRAGQLMDGVDKRALRLLDSDPALAPLRQALEEVPQDLQALTQPQGLLAKLAFAGPSWPAGVGKKVRQIALAALSHPRASKERLVRALEASVTTRAVRRRAMEEAIQAAGGSELIPEVRALLDDLVDSSITPDALEGTRQAARQMVLERGGDYLDPAAWKPLLEERIAALEKAQRMDILDLAREADIARALIRGFTDAHHARWRNAYELYRLAERSAAAEELMGQVLQQSVDQWKEVQPLLQRYLGLLSERAPNVPGARRYIEALTDLEATTRTFFLERQAARLEFFPGGMRQRPVDWNAFNARMDGLYQGYAQRRQDALARLRAARQELAQALGAPPPGAAADDVRLSDLPSFAEARQNFIDRQLATVDSVMDALSRELAAVPEDVAPAVREWAERLWGAWETVPKEAQQAFREHYVAWTRQAWEDARRMFANYLDVATPIYYGRYLFPYVVYEVHRLRYLPYLAAKWPGFVTALARYFEATDSGYIPLPAGYEINPLRGTMFSLTRNMFAPARGPVAAPASIAEVPGYISRRLLEPVGLFAGLLVTIPAAVATSAQRAAGPRPEGVSASILGEELPPAVRTALAAAGLLPGVGRYVHALQESVLGDRFREYYINKVLAQQGIAPSEATPDQREAAARVVDAYLLAAEQGQMLRLRYQEERQMREAERQAFADVLGVPREEVDRLYDQGKSPADVYPISPAEWEQIVARIPGYEAWRQATLPLREPAEAYINQKRRELWDDAARLRQAMVQGPQTPEEAALLRNLGITTTQAQDDQLLLSGQISGNEWRERRSRRLQAYRDWLEAQAQLLRAQGVPVTAEEVREFRRRSGIPVGPVHPVQEALARLGEISPADYADETGAIDWEAYYDARDAYLATLPAGVREEVEAWLKRNMSPLELRFEQVRQLWRQYNKMPRYVLSGGRTLPKETEDLVAQIRSVAADLLRMRPQLFERVPEGQKQLAAYLMAARLLGQSPRQARRLADLAKRVKTNPRRKEFLRRHPEIAVFFSDAPGLAA